MTMSDRPIPHLKTLDAPFGVADRIRRGNPRVSVGVPTV